MFKKNGQVTYFVFKNEQQQTKWGWLMVELIKWTVSHAFLCPFENLIFSLVAMRLICFLAKNCFFSWFRQFPEISEVHLLSEFWYLVLNAAAAAGWWSDAIDHWGSAKPERSFAETTKAFGSQLDWCEAGFLHENLQHQNKGGLADNEVVEDSENYLLLNLGQYAFVWSCCCLNVKWLVAWPEPLASRHGHNVMCSTSEGRSCGIPETSKTIFIQFFFI